MVPASTKIRPKSLRNVERERLVARLAWLRANGPRLARRADARVEVVHLVRQVHQIENELRRRGLAQEVSQ